MKYLPPHETPITTQLTYWNELPLETPIKLLFIDYCKCQIVKKDNGVHAFYYAIAENNIPKAGIEKGDELIFSVAHRTFQKAIHKLPKKIAEPCRSINGKGKNLYIHFERTSATYIKIHHQEIKNPTPEQLIEAEKQYNQLKEDTIAQSMEREKRGEYYTNAKKEVKENGKQNS